jgi:hypothetical protein
VSVTIERMNTAGELPAEWDTLCGHYFQKREFLSHCQRHNPCAQRYYVMTKDNMPVAGAIIYTLQIDLFTYLGVKSPLPMNIIGVPCSVSSAGMVGDTAVFAELLAGICRFEKGFILCLNLDKPVPHTPFVPGRTWPTIEYVNHCSSWNEYYASLRSAYRRRIRRVEKEAGSFEIATGACEAFNGSHYPLYEAVHRRSKGKLEKLTSGFFRNLPEKFRLTTYSRLGDLLGWTITVQEGDSFYFFLGGQNYSVDPETVYLVKLLTVLKQGIGARAQRIDLGQSAEVPKMRLGGVAREKVMMGYHGNPLARTLIRLSKGLLSYNRRYPPTHVFAGRVP